MSDMLSASIDDQPLPESMPDLRGKVALVTGTTSGFGVRFARVLAKAGAKVALTGRRVERLDALRRDITADGGEVAAFALDVTDPASISRVVGETETQLGPIDILINNAGMNVQSRAVDLSEADFNAIWQTNVSGAFFLSQCVGKRMIERGRGGRVINIGSIGSHTVLPGLTAYCMTKSAIAMMTRCLAREWARHEINVNAICPGYIRTELNADWFDTEGGQRQINGYPRRRLGLESDLDGTLLLLCSAQSRIITGTLITVDDGQSL